MPAYAERLSPQKRVSVNGTYLAEIGSASQMLDANSGGELFAATGPQRAPSPLRSMRKRLRRWPKAMAPSSKPPT